MDRDIVLIAHNLRSCNNVGSLLRTADGLGLKRIYLTGYTPYPVQKGDSRLPYIRNKIDRRIAKTSLGAENYVNWQHSEDIDSVIANLKKQGYKLIALEQTDVATNLSEFDSPNKVALIVGREIDGIEPEVLKQADYQVAIAMLGKKESFNVVQAAAMALYKFRYL